MRAFTTLNCVAAILPVDNIDTDRIIPARFLTTTTADGLGVALFADWGPGKIAARGAQMLVVGHNFGCGSSREHAVWALLDAGIRAVVSTGFADIFHSNAQRNGLLPIKLERGTHRDLLLAIGKAPPRQVTVNLENQTMTCGAFSTAFNLDPFARRCITRGLDELGYLLGQLPVIERFEAQYPAQLDTRGGTP